ncbi:ribonuclease H-like domain-containing protein [Tanacetum coccineum]
MCGCNPCRTHVDTESKLGADDDLVSDPTLHRSLAGALQYLTFTRMDLSYAVQQVCLYMHDPREPYLTDKRILRYVRGTLNHRLQLYSSSTTSLVVYSDADWAEYRGVTYVVAETCWLRNRLRKLHTPLSSATLAYCDNVSVVYLSSNPVQHQRTKPIEIDIHFVRDLVAAIQVRVLHVPSRYQWGWRRVGVYAVIWKNKCESLIPCWKPSPSITGEEENSILSLERESSLEHI